MQVRKSHIVKNDARMYYGNICNSFIHLILYHIVALGENEYEIMEDHVAVRLHALASDFSIAFK